MRRLDDLLFSVRDVWHGPTALVVAGALALVTLLSRDPLNLEKKDGRPVEAYIIGMSSLGNKYQGVSPGIQVWAMTQDGISGKTTAFPGDLAGCKIGDRIEAELSGATIYLTQRACD